MEGSNFSRSSGRNGSSEPGRISSARPSDGAPSATMAPALSSGIAGIALAALEAELADPGAWNDPRSAAKSTERHAAAKKTLEELYARWEAVAS